MSVQNLAQKIGVSKRTVQRELEYMNSSLKGYDITLQSKTGVGIWLEGSEDEKQRLFTELNQGDSYDMGNRELRRKGLILEILKEKGLKKLFYYSSKFKVSEATISGDLEAVEEWLNRYGLVVVRKPGSGISIEGSEENYRKAIREFISENMDTKLLRDSYEDDGGAKNQELLRRSSVDQILNHDVLRRVVNCLNSLNNPRVKSLTENSFVGLVIHITIAVNRIRKDEMIETRPEWSERVRADEEYHLAEEIAKALSREFEIPIPEIEVAYICLHIKGAKHEQIRWGQQETAEMENRRIQTLLNEMIDVFDPQKAVFLKQDDEFIQGLLAHLQPTFIRIAHDMQIQNPVLEDIKASYPQVFEQCRPVAQVLENWLGKPVPEAEIGYLAVHFGAALVRLETRAADIRQVHIGVVCSSGIGISRLMSSKLLRVFGDRISVTAYGKNDITSYVESRLDFFVSSIPMEAENTPIVFVSPLLSDRDMEEVRKEVYRYERLPRKREDSGFTAELDEINMAAAQISAVIKYMDFFKVDENISFDELLIAIGEKLSPYRDMGEMIREDIRKRERIATQVFAEFGFALLHARTKGVVRPCFSVCMTRDLQAFRNPYFKGIRAVFIMLVPIDDQLRINTEIMGYVSSMLIEDCDFMETVLKGDKEGIRKALSVHLKKFFNKYLSRI